MDYGTDLDRFTRWNTGAVKYRQSDGTYTNVGMKELWSSEWRYVDDDVLADRYDQLVAEKEGSRDPAGATTAGRDPAGATTAGQFIGLALAQLKPLNR